MKKILFIAVCGLSLLFLGASCYNSSNSSSSSSSTPVSTNQISIQNFAFSPLSITVSKGTTVTWTNNDSTTHRITSDTNTFNSNDLAKGDTFQFTFNQSGTFPYHCTIHPSMTGQVTVQ